MKQNIGFHGEITYTPQTQLPEIWKQSNADLAQASAFNWSLEQYYAAEEA